MARSQRTFFNKKRRHVAKDIIKNEIKNREEFIAKIPGRGSSVSIRFWVMKTECHPVVP
jgi:CRISPR/Cas system-associated endonuclease Cas1